MRLPTVQVSITPLRWELLPSWSKDSSRHVLTVTVDWLCLSLLYLHLRQPAK